MDDIYNISYKGSSNPGWEPGGSGQDTAENVARTWWLAEEATLEKLITWDRFSKGFYVRFFPSTAQKEMEEQFIRLQQLNRSVDEYAAEFLRPGRFAPYMVSDKEKWASMFQQGLKIDIQLCLIP